MFKGCWTVGSMSYVDPSLESSVVLTICSGPRTGRRIVLLLFLTKVRSAHSRAKVWVWGIFGKHRWKIGDWTTNRNQFSSSFRELDCWKLDRRRRGRGSARSSLAQFPAILGARPAPNPPVFTLFSLHSPAYSFWVHDQPIELLPESFWLRWVIALGLYQSLKTHQSRI